MPGKGLIKLNVGQRSAKCTDTLHKQDSDYVFYSLRFLCNRLAKIIHRNSDLSCIALLWQTFSAMKIMLVDQLHFEDT